MVNRNLLRQYDLPDDELQQELDAAFDQSAADWLPPEEQEFRDNKIVTGRVRKVTGDDVWVDVGYKSEGVIQLQRVVRRGRRTRSCRPSPATRSRSCSRPSRTRPARSSSATARRSGRRNGKTVIAKHKEGDVVTGKVTRKIKGGLLVDIGVNVFLPASQVDIRRPPDIADYIGQDHRVHDPQDRREPAQHRRQPPQADRDHARDSRRSSCSTEIAVGQVRKGDGQEHRRLRRVRRPGRHRRPAAHHRHELGPDQPSQRHGQDRPADRGHASCTSTRTSEKIALGLKQKSPSPWAERRRRSTRSAAGITGEVVNVMSYGAFVKLEEGIEGLVHISEMSWTKRINHPSELVHIGDKIEVVVLDINKEKQEISLGMKQTQANPWDQVAEQVSARHDGRGHRSATSPTTAPSSRSRKASTACCTSAT